MAICGNQTVSTDFYHSLSSPHLLEYRTSQTLLDSLCEVKRRTNSSLYMLIIPCRVMTVFVVVRFLYSTKHSTQGQMMTVWKVPYGPSVPTCSASMPLLVITYYLGCKDHISYFLLSESRLALALIRNLFICQDNEKVGDSMFIWHSDLTPPTAFHSKPCFHCLW